MSFEIISSIIFAIALLHTFSTKLIEKIGQRVPKHHGVFHLLGEIEVVFGFWAMILMIIMFFHQGKSATIHYLEQQVNFTEPMFVFAIMVISATKPVLNSAMFILRFIARLIPGPDSVAFYIVSLTLLPLLGSLITEPAAMTVAALALRDRLFAANISTKLKYVTLGVLFVNISIGGTLTHFAAPPVLMVATPWQWDIEFMFRHFGYKAICAVVVNTLIATLCFYKELKLLSLARPTQHQRQSISLAMLHFIFIAGLVIFAHHPIIFMSIFMLFLGLSAAYQHYHDKLMLRESLLVAFFLAGLVVLGGQQQWWLKDLLTQMSHTQIFFGATALTAITDNAAITYLGSLVPNLSEMFKYMLVAGAVTGGGLTIIANAPNPAGASILRDSFADGQISPLGLLIAALYPTLIAGLCFLYL